MNRHLVVSMLSTLSALSACASHEEAAVERLGQALAKQPYGALFLEELDGADGPSSFSYRDVTDQDLEALANRRVAIAMHWPSTEIDDPDRWDFVSHAQSFGVDIHPWLLLPNDPGPKGGYFANASNYVEFITRAEELMYAWERNTGLPATTFIVDMEMRREQLDTLRDLQGRDASTEELVSFMADEKLKNLPVFEEARRAYKAFVRCARRIGTCRISNKVAGIPAWRPTEAWDVQAIAFPQLVDDFFVDDDEDIAIAFGTPLEGIEWSRVSFMAFRTLFSGAAGAELTPFFVYDYLCGARDRWGERAGVLIGATDPGIVNDLPTYKDAADMRRDLEAAATAGVSWETPLGLPAERIGVYSFNGIAHREEPLTTWLQNARDPYIPVPDTGTLMMHTTSYALDAALTWVW